MVKRTITIAAVAASAVLSMAALTGCAGGSSTSSSSTSNTNTSNASVQSTSSNSNNANTSSQSTSSTGNASTSATSSTGNTSTSTSSTTSTKGSSLINIDGADLVELDVEMVGETPNFSTVFRNDTDQDVTIDCSKFKVLKEDGTEVSFALSDKTIKANTPRSQSASTASAGTLALGDKVTVFYDGQSLGEYEVGEF